MAFLEKLCCLLKLNQIKICETCDTPYTDELQRKVFVCINDKLRTAWLGYWNHLASQFPSDVCAYLRNNIDDTQLMFLLGYVDITISDMLNTKQISELLNYNAAFLRAVYVC